MEHRVQIGFFSSHLILRCLHVMQPLRVFVCHVRCLGTPLSVREPRRAVLEYSELLS